MSGTMMYQTARADTLLYMRRFVAAVACVVAVAGCGGTTRSITDGQPSCKDVWQVGKTLPSNYEGCVRPDGDLQAGVSTTCEDGPGLTSVDPADVGLPAGHWWAFLGGQVQHGKGYRHAYWTDCKGF